MKILMVVATPFVLEKGSSLRVLHIVRTLAAAGHRIDVVTYPVGNDVTIKKVRVFRARAGYRKTTPGPSVMRVFADLALYQRAKQLLKRNRYDVVHGEDTEGGYIACMLGKKFRKPVVYDMHNLMSEQMRLHQWYLLIPAAKLIEKRLLGQPELIIVNWEKLEKDIRKTHPQQRTALLFDAVNLDVMKPVISLPQRYILYSGNFEKYQGLELLLHAYQKAGVKEKLVLVGEPRARVLELMKDLRLEKRVLAVGKLPVEEANYAIQHSLFCVIPRVHGRQPSMKVIHYFENRKTILATDIACNHELMVHGKNALLAKPEINVFAKAMKRLSMDKKLRQRLEKGIEQVLPKISQEVGVKRLIDAYKKLKS